MQLLMAFFFQLRLFCGGELERPECPYSVQGAGATAVSAPVWMVVLPASDEREGSLIHILAGSEQGAFARLLFQLGR